MNITPMRTKIFSALALVVFALIVRFPILLARRQKPKIWSIEDNKRPIATYQDVLYLTNGMEVCVNYCIESRKQISKLLALFAIQAALILLALLVYVFNLVF